MSSKFLFALVPFFLLACSSSGDDSGAGGNAGTGATGGSSGSGGSSAQCITGTTATLQAANNYTFASNITLMATKVKANEPNLDFDWSGVTTDFLGRKMDPAKDIDSTLLVILSLTVDQFAQHLNADDGTLTQFNQGALQLLTNKTLTKGNLEDFGVPTQPQNTYKTSADVKKGVDDYLNPATSDPSKTILALMPSTGTDAGSGARMIQVFTVDTASTTTSLALGSNMRTAAGANGHTGGTTGPSMSVTYDTSLQKLTPLGLPAGSPNITVDWSGLTMNGLGRTWEARSITKLTVGHYTQSLTELENQFFDLETIAASLYSAYVPSDEPMSLSGLKDAQMNPFPGIDDSGTWIMALFCDPKYCGNPAPWFLTVLKTCK
jgi:hypothetical protein